MTKITKAEPAGPFRIALTFSDGSSGVFDAQALIGRDSPLTLALRDPHEFDRYYLELGALCWRNGLELSAESLRRKLLERGELRGKGQVAA